jgi:3-dehydroquinate synthase II
MHDDRLSLLIEVPEPELAASIRERAGRRGFRVLTEPGRKPNAPEEVTWSSGGLELGAGGTAARIEVTTVSSPEQLAQVADRLRAGHAVLVEWPRERVLPLETLVAERRRPGTLWVITDRTEDVPVFLGALEHGADHVILRIREADALDRLELVLEAAVPALIWVEAKVSGLRPAGLGDRVIVDTTSLLRHDEGMFVGSSAALLLLVTSEAAGSRFTRPRPFRVNAGAAHQYTLLANGDTRYLSELEPGDAVVVATPRGPGRSVRVGRLKIERRPLTHVTVEEGGRKYTSFLQEAETVRLVRGDTPVGVGELRTGESVRAITLPRARHLGRSIEEQLEER